MKRFGRALKKAFFVFIREMKGPDKRRIAENRENLIDTWLSIDYTTGRRFR